MRSPTPEITAPRRGVDLVQAHLRKLALPAMTDHAPVTALDGRKAESPANMQRGPLTNGAQDARHVAEARTIEDVTVAAQGDPRRTEPPG